MYTMGKMVQCPATARSQEETAASAAASSHSMASALPAEPTSQLKVLMGLGWGAILNTHLGACCCVCIWENRVED